MAESESVDMEAAMSGEFRGRQHSFHSVASFHQKAGSKRAAAVPLDFAEIQRPRLSEEAISMSAPMSSFFTSVTSSIVQSAADTVVLSISAGTEDTEEVLTDGVDEEEAIPVEIALAAIEGALAASPGAQLNDPSSPDAANDPPKPDEALEADGEEEEVEDEEEEGEPRKIVRPEDISLHNPDSGLGYRASKTEYHTDDSDDGQEDFEEVEEVEEMTKQPEITDADDSATSHSDTAEEEWVPSPRETDPLKDIVDLVEGAAAKMLPYTTPLDLQMNFDPTEHMGLLMIDPSHQDRFNELYVPPVGLTAYETLLNQYEAENAIRFEHLENALMLNTELDDVDEVVEIIEEEDEEISLPPANPPCSPTFLEVSQ